MTTINEKISKLETELKALKLQVEKEAVSYPVGYCGKWVVSYDYFKNKYSYEKIENYCDCEEHRTGFFFKTEQQAQQKADGLNNLKELIFAVHEANKKHGKEFSTAINFCYNEGKKNTVGYVNEIISFHPDSIICTSTPAASEVYKKLGSACIYSAIRYGLG